MPEALARLQQQALELWKDMDKSQKTRMIFIAILVIASVSVGIFIITRPSYKNLFNGSLDSKEVSEIIKILKDSRIEPRVIDNGNTIQVKAKDEEAARLAVTQAGYPKSGTTFFKDTLSSVKLSTTESDKKKLYKEFDEQKIASGLKKIDNIIDATVNLSIPEKDVFLGDPKEQKPSAAVLVEARSELTKKQVEGIVRFVAASVENLEAKDVKVIDKNTGNTLSNSGDDDVLGGSSSQFELQETWKKVIENQVLELFSNRYDGIKVGANIVCDFNTEISKEVQYTPVVGDDSGILRSTETHKEDVQNGTSGGVPGTDSNGTDGTTTYKSTNGSGTYKKTDIVNNFEINQKNVDRTKAIGQPDPEKSSITVSFLYGKNVPDAPTKADIDEAVNMISKATGILSNNIAIASFKVLAAKVEAPKTDWMKLVSQIGPIAVLGIFIILLAIGIVRRGSQVNRGLAFEGGNIKPSIAMAVKDDEDLPEINLEEKSEVKKQIDKFIKRKPDAVAQLLRNWLSDDWD